MPAALKSNFSLILYYCPKNCLILFINFFILDQKVDESIPRCCGGDIEEMSSQCSKTPIITNTEASDSYKSFWLNGSQIIYQKSFFKNETINKDATNYCVGPSWSHSNSFDYQNPIEMKLFILPEPCKEETPCPKNALSHFLSEMVAILLQLL